MKRMISQIFFILVTLFIFGFYINLMPFFIKNNHLFYWLGSAFFLSWVMIYLVINYYQNKKLKNELTQFKKDLMQTSIKKNITDYQEPEKRSPDLMQYDAVTHLPNRIFFTEVLNKALNHAKRHHKLCAVLLFEFRQEKNKKDSHFAEDENLIQQQIAQCLKQALRAEDILAKMENNLFIVLLNDIRKAKFASTVSQKIIQSCSHPIKVNNRISTFIFAIGICIYPIDGTDSASLLKNVEIALATAKESRENNYKFYTPELDSEAREFIALDQALRTAVSRQQFELYYQPKLDLASGRICGLEALIRWHHPKHGIINPAQFIPLAEDVGLIMEIGEWALREACKQNKYWQEQGYGHLTVALNLSPKQFNHPQLVNVITRVLTETRLIPQYLELEIDESTVMGDIKQAIEKLNLIKQTGVQISLDHFGTGYTSISHLKLFPINILKIDKSFIKGIPQIPNDMAITNAFIALAHQLGLAIIAEGVETAEQVQYLAAQNCDMIQGYYLSHPLPADKVALQFKRLEEEVLG